MTSKHMPGSGVENLPCYLCSYSNDRDLVEIICESHSYVLPICRRCVKMYDLCKNPLKSEEKPELMNAVWNWENVLSKP